MNAMSWAFLGLMVVLAAVCVYAFWPVHDRHPLDLDEADNRAHGRKP